VNKLILTAPATTATLTLAEGSTLATAGAFATTLTATAATNVTLPVTGTLATLAGTEILINKTFVGPALGTPASGVATNLIGTASGLSIGGNAATVTTIPALTGDVNNNANAITIVANAVTTGKITDAAVTYAKIQNVGATRLLGNPTAAVAVASEITIGSGLNLTTAGVLSAPAQAVAISIKTGAYTATAADNTILCDATSAGFTVTLPAASAAVNAIYSIRKIDETANILSFTPAIYASATTTFTTLNYSRTIRVQSNGTNWYQID
ncbi:hypothetical protein ACM55I_16280, partial [Flavobacterium sp. GB2R13]|uniref:hypothetical protein n=1 Tax=Flavobacterium algoris TaxID=3398733 RepID=UPI003A88B24D